MEIRHLEPDEVQVFRSILLKALSESPECFLESLEEASKRSDEEWVARITSRTDPDRSVAFVADDNGDTKGLVFCGRDDQEQDLGHVGGLWVDSSVRGRDIAEALLESAIHWARARGMSRLSVWCTEDNHEGRRLYQQSGFVDSGLCDEHGAEPARKIHELALNLEDH